LRIEKNENGLAAKRRIMQKKMGMSDHGWARINTDGLAVRYAISDLTFQITKARIFGQRNGGAEEWG
jgi:hypothetical protein